ncbi:MAG: hypothetical protein JXA67_12825, partial [Micromonosporaceae bacterium]|nr:hypothetical protein [Micromonosporaceae bacterium]
RPGPGAGVVTRLRAGGSAKAPAGEPSGSAEAGGSGAVVEFASRDRTVMRWFAGAAATIVVLGLLTVTVLFLTGQRGGTGVFDRPLAGPNADIPDLARQCPLPSDIPERQRGEIPPTPPGPRTVDPEAGISYAAYGAPWTVWDQVWSGGDLKVTYRIGQHFITEQGPLGDGYHASVLSGSVPATVNDAMVVDLECTGRLVAADVRTEYYFQPNTMDLLSDEERLVGGLPAWVTKFRLHFDRPGLKAKDELAAVVLLDVGRPEAAILYVSIPGTHREWDYIVDEVIDSIRPA